MAKFTVVDITKERVGNLYATKEGAYAEAAVRVRKFGGGSLVLEVIGAVSSGHPVVFGADWVDRLVESTHGDGSDGGHGFDPRVVNAGESD